MSPLRRRKGKGSTVDGERFDDAVRILARGGSRRRVLGGLLAAAAGLRLGWASAQDTTTASGNGGTADAGANGGAVGTGDVNSGDNAGNGAGVGDTVGDVDVDGGAAANATDLDVEADGGAAIADGSGGDENVAIFRLTCNPASNYDRVGEPGAGSGGGIPGLETFPPLPGLPELPPPLPGPDPDPDPEPGPDPDPGPDPEPEPDIDPDAPPCTCPCSGGMVACPGGGDNADLYTCCQRTPGTPNPCGQNPNNGYMPNCSGGSGPHIQVDWLCIGE